MSVKALMYIEVFRQVDLTVVFVIASPPPTPPPRLLPPPWRPLAAYCFSNTLLSFSGFKCTALFFSRNRSCDLIVCKPTDKSNIYRQLLNWNNVSNLYVAVYPGSRYFSWRFSWPVVAASRLARSLSREEKYQKQHLGRWNYVHYVHIIVKTFRLILRSLRYSIKSGFDRRT